MRDACAKSQHPLSSRRRRSCHTIANKRVYGATPIENTLQGAQTLPISPLSGSDISCLMMQILPQRATSRFLAAPGAVAQGVRPTLALVLACLMLFGGGPAQSQAIFKSVDSSGRVIYSQEPVAGAVTVEKVDVTPKVVVDRPPAARQGAADAQRAETQRQSEEFRLRQAAREAQRQKAMEEVNAAERALGAAQKALVAGQEPTEIGDRQGIGGVRSRPTEQYLDRVRRLEAELEAAKKRLYDAQTRLRDIQ